MPDTGIPSGRNSSVSLPDVVQTAPIRRQRCFRAIGRPIIDQDDLQIPIRLRENTGDRRRDVPNLVVGSDDYADGRPYQLVTPPRACPLPPS